MIGSSNTDLPFVSASRNAARDAISKASADESTSWYLQSTSCTLTSTTGKPETKNEQITLARPFSTPVMYSFGTAPPTTLDSNSKPLPGSLGSTTIDTSAN